MDKFKKRLQNRVIWMSIIIIILGSAYLILSQDIINLPPIPEFIKGFHMGAFCGIELLLVFFTVKYLVSMKNEEALKKLYIEENDERTCMIMQKTGGIGMSVSTVVMGCATVIAGFFDTTVFFTLLAATAFNGLVRGVCKVYYHIKM